MQRLAIDPGDIHVGWAWHDHEGDVDSGEWSPVQCVDEVVYMMTRNLVDELVVEEFVLYPESRGEQTWSPMKTSQLIGGLKVVAHFFRIPVVEQGAYIKKPTRAQLRARGIDTSGVSIHARDAILHLHHRRLRAEKEGK